MKHVLVVANQTAVSTNLTRRVYELKESDPDVTVHIAVPATPRSDSRVDADGRAIYDADGLEQAAIQLREATAAFKKIGVTVTGMVGPSDPMKTIETAMRDYAVDLIVVSTLPLGTSRWLAMDLPHRVARRFDAPVEHVLGDEIEETHVHHPVTGAVKALVIEDQPADIALVTKAIERSSSEVEMKVAKNGAEALDYLRTYGVDSVDLLLLDLKMPVLDGHQFLEAANNEFDMHDLFVAVLTTSTNDADRERAHALGAGAFLVKDPDFNHFATSVDSILAEVAAG